MSLKSNLLRNLKKYSFVLVILLILISTVFIYAYLIQKPQQIQTDFGAVLGGDCDGDGTVDIIDFQLLSNTFGKSVGQSGYDARCNFNGDTIVDILDFQILSNNFGKTGGTSTPTPKITTPATPTLGPTPTGTAHITYSPILDDIGNPERGFMKQSSVWVDKPYSSGAVSTVQPTDRVVWIYLHLDNYRDPRDGPGVNLTNYQGKALEPLGSGVGLDTINNMFKDARNKGLKLVIRFLYVGYSGIGSNSDPNSAQPDAPLSLVQQHSSQLAPVLQQNKDVIAAVQFGFVGYFGEWHSSKYLYTLAARKAVMDAVLAATPKDRMIQVRYPRYILTFYGGPLTDAQGFSQSDLARIGVHDDAFFKDSTDDGTFKSTTAGTKITNYCDGFSAGEVACWKDFISKQTKYTPFGGEAGTHSSTPDPSADCSNAVPTMNNLHLSFLHNGYSKVTLDHWVNQGCMPEIRRRMGYRIELKDAFIPPQVTHGNTLSLQVNLRNVGFASMYNPRPIYLVLLGGSRYEIPIPQIDPRRWASGQDSTFSTNVTIPSNVVPGTYRLGLWLPDASTTIRNNVNYSVRFANTNTWDSTTGINIITNNFRVQ